MRVGLAVAALLAACPARAPVVEGPAEFLGVREEKSLQCRTPGFCYHWDFEDGYEFGFSLLCSGWQEAVVEVTTYRAADGREFENWRTLRLESCEL